MTHPENPENGQKPQGIPPASVLPNHPDPSMGPRTPEGYVACPQCNSVYVDKVGFTWWGGVLGPKLLSAVKCGQCRYQFNGKTGASLKGPIAIYMIVVFIIAFAVLAAVTAR